jgi:tetratricopeptide (TPR) repeat protein
VTDQEQDKPTATHLSETGDGDGGVECPGSEVHASIRASANGYLSFILIGTFFVGLLFRLQLDVFALALMVLTWVVTPALLLADKINFDGKILRRTGIIPGIWGRITDAGVSLSLDEIELVESQALRALRKGGDVYYRYRTLIAGKDIRFSLVSGGEQYRTMIKALLPKLPEGVLDYRSVELRDYLADPKEVQTKTRFAKIPSTAVLESALKGRIGTLKKRAAQNDELTESSDISDRLEFLRQLANELRIAGYLVQALEVFRRALRLDPGNGWLVFEFARCLHSYGGAEKNPKIERRALAALRLSEKKARGDERLLARLGETYFQYGDWKGAKRAFQKTLDLAGNSYRSVRGMAELSLREGKIAHVIHNFSVANRLAETPALRRWTSSEAAYFERLNADDEYMDMEISRVTMLDNLERYKKTALRITMIGLPCIVLGMTMNEPQLANLGWAVSCIALVVWGGIVVGRNLLSSRIPLEND